MAWEWHTTLWRWLLAALLPVTLPASAQSFNYWTRNFNEESSLVSGAVVGGGAGPSAIYYNPAVIGEKSNSQFSIHASLFSMNQYNIRNALGNGVDLSSTQFIVEPRFISYMMRPHHRWTVEFAFLNNENYRLDLNTSLDMQVDVLRHLPGEERYYARFRYTDRYRDDWVGAGFSYRINAYWKAGMSMMVPIRSLDYNYLVDLSAMPLSDTILTGEGPVPYYSARYEEMDYIHLNNYRLLWKGGLLYHRGRVGWGLSVTTPSVNVYADGKRVARRQSRSNIMAPDTAVMLPDQDLVDYKEKKDVKVDLRTPWSVALGGTFQLPARRKQMLYLTAEYFASLKPYRVVEAEELRSSLQGREWLTFVSGGRAILNVAAGYNVYLRENLQLMGGFRTDFNARKDLDLSPFEEAKKIKGLTLDIYRFSGGMIFTFKGQDIIMGVQYSIGREAGREQFANLAEPVEYNEEIGMPLQGTPHDNMRILSNNLNFYFGATFNFNSSKQD